MNEQAINDIKNALREMMQLLVQRGEPLSDEMKQRVAQVMEHAANRIQQLRQDEQGSAGLPPIDEVEEEQDDIANGPGSPPEQPPLPPTGGNVPHLDPAPHESSNINAFKYDYDNQKLYVKFQGKYPSQNGPIYQYDGVQKYIFDLFRRGAVPPKTSGSNQWHTWKEGVTPSHGAAMYALIKSGGYRYQRLS